MMVRDLRKEPEMGYEKEPWWLDLVLIGFEDDDEDNESEDDEDEDDEEESDDEEDDDDSDEEDEEDEDEEDEDDSKSKPKKKNIAGLKSALRKERMGHKKFKRLYEAEKKKNKTPSKTVKDKKDDQEEQEDKGPSERERRLAGRFKDKAIDAEILKFAQKHKFIDPEDAVRLVKRVDIEFDQDDDDPTLIEIDEESVEDAVKELARKKKHLIGKLDRKVKSGSKFGGSKGKSKEASEETLRKTYGLTRAPM
jgi:hypothetical protein